MIPISPDSPNMTQPIKPILRSALALLALALPTSAATLVTGAGSGQGISLVSANVVYALNITGIPSPNYLGPFQGVTFQAGNPNLTVGSGTWGVFGNANTDFSGGTAEEQALNNLAKEIFFTVKITNGVDGTINIAGLQAGTSYHLDLLQTIGGYASRTQDILLNGTVVDTVALTQNSGDVWNTSVTGVADIDGRIVLGFDCTTGDGPVFSTLVVSSVPEPSALLLGGLGALGLLRRRR